MKSKSKIRLTFQYSADSLESSGIHRGFLLSCYATLFSQQFFCLSSQRVEIEKTHFISGTICNRKFTLESSIANKMKSLFQIQRGQMSYYAKKFQIKCGELVRIDSSLSQSFYSFLQKYIF